MLSTYDKTISIHIQSKRQDLNLVIFRHEISGYMIDHIALPIFKTKFTCYLMKGFIRKQYHILTVQRANGRHVADTIHFFTLLYYTWAPLRELGNVQRRLDSEHGNPADAYLRTMRFGLFVVCAFAVISPLYILSRPLLFVFGPLGLISLSLFIVSFTALGFSMSEGVTEIVTETNDEIAAAKVFREIGPERIAEIDMAVSKWRSEGGFRDSDLTLSSFARRIMVNRTDVASYLTSIYGKNFRTWLSGIRVEEAKALMAAHPEYSNEVVSMECGFSSRVYFQRLFKERTGLTPAEWRRQR